jgi:hypothetical protein
VSAGQLPRCGSRRVGRAERGSHRCHAYRGLLHEAEDGIVVSNERCTVGDAVRDWRPWPRYGGEVDTKDEPAPRRGAHHSLPRRPTAPRSHGLRRRQVARRPGQGCQHEYSAEDPFGAQSIDQAGDGAGQGQAERRRAGHAAEGSGGPTVQVADVGAGPGDSRCCRRHQDAGLRRRFAPDRRPYRGTPRSAMDGR